MKLDHGGTAELRPDIGLVVFDLKPNGPKEFGIAATDLMVIFYELLLPWYLANYEVTPYARRV